MRVRLRTRWLAVLLAASTLAPLSARAQSPTAEPTPPPTVLTQVPQERPEPPEVKPATPLSDSGTKPAAPPGPAQVKPAPVVVADKPGTLLPPIHGQVLGTSCGPVLDGGMPPLSESSTGFLDTALIATHLRLRFDGNFRNTRPDRAAYVMAQTQEMALPISPFVSVGGGMPLVERKINMEVLSLYGEYAFCERFSAFAELPIRALQPDINSDHISLADVNVGAKLAFFALPDLVQTIQCKIWCPTGNPHDGMGSDLFAIEPAYLVYNRLTPRWTLEGEISDWLPLGAPEFAGSVLRYGLSAAYDYTVTANGWYVRPVFGLWGVAFLHGRQTVIGPTGPILEEARERILNADIGVRLGGNESSLYVGYSQVLSGSSLFEQQVRIEFRCCY